MINNSVINGNFPRFFQKLKKTQNFLFACIMLPQLNNMRKLHLDALFKANIPN